LAKCEKSEQQAEKESSHWLLSLYSADASFVQYFFDDSKNTKKLEQELQYWNIQLKAFA